MNRRRVLTMSLSYMALLVLTLLFVAPILLMVVGSLKPEARVLVEAGSLRAFVPTQWDLHNYRDVFARVNFSRYLFNSLFINGMVVSAGLVVNSLAGYAFAWSEWRGRKVLFALVLAVLILPLEAIAVPPFYRVTLFGWRDAYLVQIIPFVANAFSVYLFYAFFLGLPRELEKVARIDGAGIVRTLIARLQGVSSLSIGDREGLHILTCKCYFFDQRGQVIY